MKCSNQIFISYLIYVFLTIDASAQDQSRDIVVYGATASGAVAAIAAANEGADVLLVEPGQEVPVGGRLALSGSTGNSTAPHVHYEVRVNDKPINPLESLRDETNQ